MSLYNDLFVLRGRKREEINGIEFEPNSIFNDMNNGFGWGRLPKSFMNGNTVFLLLTAFIHNFYKTIIKDNRMKEFGLQATSRIKAFVFKFILVPAKWTKTARQYILNVDLARKWNGAANQWQWGTVADLRL